MPRLFGSDSYAASLTSSSIVMSNVPQPTALRKRMRVLERAQSLSNLHQLPSADVLPDLKLKHAEVHEESLSSPQTEYYESRSDSSGADQSTGEEERQEPRRGTSAHVAGEQHLPVSPKARAWYEFDLAVVAALVSPLGQWMTGGDHVKNLLLIFLLIFYLHQIIEIPWSLYQKARPRTRAARMAAWDASPNSPEARYSQLAASELQKFEFLFLFLTFVSPLLGAALLRYATEAVLGPDSVSWFSTGLFVLATGMRPWSHLVDRLNQRTSDLQDFVHYPSVAHGVPLEEHNALAKRVAHLEKSIAKIKAKVDSTTEDVYDYVDDAVDAVDHAMRKQERKWDRYEAKMKEVEQTVGQLRSEPAKAILPSNIGTVKAFMGSVVDHVVPVWLTSMKHLYYDAEPSPHPKIVRRHSRTGSGSGSRTPTTPLETIVEEEYPLYMQPRQKRSSISILLQPYYLTASLVYQVGYIMTTPLRVVARMVTGHY